MCIRDSLATALMNLLWKLQLREPSRKPENTNFSPVKLFLDCLRYWVTDYRVAGFRFNLASILGRNEDGSPMSQPPLLQSLAFDQMCIRDSRNYEQHRRQYDCRYIFFDTTTSISFYLLLLVLTNICIKKICLLY